MILARAAVVLLFAAPLLGLISNLVAASAGRRRAADTYAATIKGHAIGAIVTAAITAITLLVFALTWRNALGLFLTVMTIYGAISFVAFALVDLGQAARGFRALAERLGGAGRSGSTATAVEGWPAGVMTALRWTSTSIGCSICARSCSRMASSIHVPARCCFCAQHRIG